MSSELSELGQAAVWYCENGFGIIPIQPRGKRPLTANGLKDWFDNPEDARKLWTQRPDLNIAIVCGSASGNLVVLDFDEDDEKDVHGFDTLADWEDESGELPATATAVTGRGGMHYLYRAEKPYHPSVNRDLGVDVRGEGSYIVAPPSIHPNGRPYEWNMGDAPWERDVAMVDANVDSFIDHIQRNGGVGQDDGVQGERFQLPQRIKPGERNDVLYSYGCSLRCRGYADDAIDAMLHQANERNCVSPVEEAELKGIIKQVCKKGPGIDGNGTFRGENVGIGKPGTPTAATLEVNGNGTVKQTTSNMIVALGADEKLAGRFWYDTMAYTRMVTCPVPWDARSGERPITDEDYIGLTAYLEISYHLTAKERIIDACQFVCKQNERNPVTEWLDSLVWDGERRVGSLIVDALGARDYEYNREVERLFMLGAVTRAYEPGSKFDYMPVLVGPQGIGKSRYVSLLAHIPAWYNDNFNTIDGDAAVEKLRGLWIAEMAELLATKKAREIEAIKAFITSTKDVIRPKYARETVQRMRVCVFIGTTNSHDFLTDATGNRRFLPVECGATTCNEWMFTRDAESHVEQMWAEAVHIYKTEHPVLVLDASLQGEAQRLQEAHTEEHPVVTLATKVIGEKWWDKSQAGYAGTPSERLCTREVFLALPDDIQRGGLNKLVQTDIITALDASGEWERMPGKQKTRDFGATRCWIPIRR